MSILTRIAGMHLCAAMLLAADASVARADEPAAALSTDPLRGTVMVGRHWNGREKESLAMISAAHPVILTHELLKMSDAAGIPISTLDHASVEMGLDHYVVCIVTSAALDRDTVLKNLAPGAESVEAEGRKYYSYEPGKFDLCFYDDRTLIRTNLGGMKTTLTRSDLADCIAGLPSARATPTMLASLQVTPDAFGPIMAAAGPNGQAFAPLLAAKHWRIDVDAAEKLKIHIEGKFADDDSAQRALSPLENVAKGLGQYLTMAGTQMPKFLEQQTAAYPKAGDVAGPMKASIDGICKALAVGKPEQTGSSVVLSLDVDTDEPATAAILLLSLAPRAKKK